MRKTSVALDRKETEGAVWRIWFLTLGFELLSRNVWQEVGGARGTVELERSEDH